jgi:DNA-directed RNA polymerase
MEDIFSQSSQFAAEQLTVLHAALSCGDIKRAKRLLASIKRHDKEFLQNDPSLDIKIRNAFIQAYLMDPANHGKEALRELWMMKQAGLTPGITTYAILLHGFLS